MLGFATPALAQPTETETGNTAPSSGLQFSVKLEPGLAVALSEPQSDKTEPGFRQTIKALFGVSRHFAIGPSAAFTTLPSTPMNTGGTAWAFGATARFERPRDNDGASRLSAASPWVDVDLQYVRTGVLNRPGFDAAVGLAIPLGDERIYWLGPFVRYSQILQGDRAGFDNRDAKIISVGLSLEIGTARKPRAAAAPVYEEERRVEEPVAVVEPIADRDQDTVRDSEDNCPDVAGPVSNAGCPVYQKVVVKPDKLELKEKIAFKWSSAILEPESYPLLDEVAQALKDNRGFKVQVEGHASSDGDTDYNQTLSEQRASAVLDYLIKNGVASDRIISKGFGSTTPTQTNTTAAGRDANRRVEFVVSFIIVEKAN